MNMTSKPEWLNDELHMEVLGDLLDSDDRQILDTVDRFIVEHVEPNAEEIDEKDVFPREMYGKAAEIGLFAMAMPEEYGGLNTRLLTQFLVSERLTRSSPGFALTVTTTPDSLVGLRLYGTDAQKEMIIPKVVTGEYVTAMALSEPGGGSDLGALKTQAERNGDTYVLNGTKQWCTHGSVSDIMIVLARTDPTAGNRGISAFIVPSNSPGIKFVRDEELIGVRGSPTSLVEFTNVEIPESNRIGDEGQGFKIAMRTLDEARLSCAANGLGIAHRCIFEAIEYARQRQAFGKPIIQHQGLQFLLADLASETIAAREVWLKAALMLEEGNSLSSFYASIAKNRCTDIGMKAPIEAIQVLGATGLSRQMKLERFMRDAKALQIFDGPTQIQNMIIGRHLDTKGLPLW